MKSLKAFALIVLAAAASSAAAQGTDTTALRDTTPVRDTIVMLDRIVAVVGDQPITEYDVQQRILAMEQQPGFQRPQSADDERQLHTNIVSTLIDEELLVQKAALAKVDVADNDLNASIDRQLREIRSHFNSDAEFRAELQRAGLGSQEEYRRLLTEQLRRQELQQRVIEKMRADGKIPPVNVSEAEVQDAFDRNKSTLPRRPATVTFRQIVIAP
jgi:peptidyl-prolyl cis-trans isomerase SurA